MDRVKGFLVSKALLKGDPSAASHPLSRLRGENVSGPPFLHDLYFFDMIFVISQKISAFDIKRTNIVLTPYPCCLVSVTQMTHDPSNFSTFYRSTCINLN